MRVLPQQEPLSCDSEPSGEMEVRFFATKQTGLRMKSSRTLRWLAGPFFGGLLAASSVQAAFVQVANDTLAWSSSEVEIFAHGPSGVGWNATTTMFEYTVFADATSGKWKYVYDFDVGSKAISHIIIELSANLGLCGTAVTTDCISYTSGGSVAFDTFSSTSNGNSNPQMPSPMYGIKFTPGSVTSATLVMITDRAPQWGDFYARDGVDNVQSGPNQGRWDVAAWNAGFGLTDWALTEADFNAMLYGIGSLTKYDNKILRPDTRTGIPPCVGDECEGSPPQGIPEPSSLALLGIGLLGAGLAKRRQRR